MAGPMKLTPKQVRFVQEYLIDPNAAQAAIRAGYSAKTARVIGHENLTKPDIAAAIEKAMAERAERTRLSAANHASYTGDFPPPAHRYRASTRSPLWAGAPIQPCLT